MTGTNGKTPVLDLDDLVEHGTDWKLDGKHYTYVRWASLGLLERRRIANLQTRLFALEELPKPTKADGAEYERLLDEVVKRITVAVPADVLCGMDAEQKSEVFTRFLAWRLVRISMLTAKRSQHAALWAGTKSPGTSERSSRASTAGGQRRTRKSG